MDLMARGFAIQKLIGFAMKPLEVRTTPKSHVFFPQNVSRVPMKIKHLKGGYSEVIYPTFKQSHFLFQLVSHQPLKTNIKTIKTLNSFSTINHNNFEIISLTPRYQGASLSRVDRRNQRQHRSSPRHRNFAGRTSDRNWLEDVLPLGMGREWQSNDVPSGK